MGAHNNLIENGQKAKLNIAKKNKYLFIKKINKILFHINFRKNLVQHMIQIEHLVYTVENLSNQEVLIAKSIKKLKK